MILNRIIMQDSLMQMLEEAQNMDVTRKLSERTTVELISKITEKKRIDLIKYC